MPEQKTLGEQRIRTSFNPSDDSNVQHIKERAAEMINYVNDNLKLKAGVTHEEAYEFTRLKMNALDAIEVAAMWAVKAATV